MDIELFFIDCPHCHAWYIYSAVLSYSTYGNEERWTDGKWLGSPFEPSFTSCSQCNTFFWKRTENSFTRYLPTKYTDENGNFMLVKAKAELKYDMSNLKRLQSLAKAMQESEIPFARSNEYDLGEGEAYEFNENFTRTFMELGFYQTALKELECSDSKDELEIRIPLWHTLNDFVRYNYSKRRLRNDIRFFLQKPSLYLSNQKKWNEKKKEGKKLFEKNQTLFRGNLERIIVLLNEKGDLNWNEQDLLVEAHRELGNIKEARKLYHLFNEKKIKHFTNVYFRALLFGKQHVFEL